MVYAAVLHVKKSTLNVNKRYKRQDVKRDNKNTRTFGEIEFYYIFDVTLYMFLQ